MSALAVVGLGFLTEGVSSASQQSSDRQVRAYFNGDGFADIAIGVPNEDQAGADDGAVNVIYGSAGGLTSTGNQVWSQDSPGIAGAVCHKESSELPSAGAARACRRRPKK